MISVNFMWSNLICIALLISYIVAAKNIRWLPTVPVGLFITFLGLLLLSDMVEGYEWSVDLSRYISIWSDVILSWAVARVVFWLLMEILSRFKDNKDVLPKITRDFILFLTFAILFLLVLRVRSNVNLASLLTTSAVLTVVIGLAAQATLSNFFSGLIIQAERPFAIGDWIEFGDKEGRVIGISWKSTQLLTREQVLVYIPNSVLASSTFSNFSKPTKKKIVRIYIGVEYGAPPNKVTRVINEVLAQHLRVLKRPRPNIRLIEFGDFAITYEIRIWHKSYAYEPQLKADINQQLWYALRRNNIRIPFPIRDVFHGHIERKYQEKTERQLRSETERMLENVHILSPLSDSERADLARHAGIEEYGAGELIFREGDPGDSMYIIRSGVCDAMKIGDDKKKKHLSTMQKGDFFGEISLLTGEKRTATVQAKEDTLLIEIDKDMFSHVIFANPQISEQIAKVVVARQQKKGIPMDDLEDITNSSMKFIRKIKDFFRI